MRNFDILGFTILEEKRRTVTGGLHVINSSHDFQTADVKIIGRAGWRKDRQSCTRKNTNFLPSKDVFH